MLFVGIDWAETRHAVCILDEAGAIRATQSIPDDLDGVRQFHDLLAAQASAPAEIVIGIETDRGLLVRALVAAGYQLYALNPAAVSHYRGRHTPSGSKSDPGDAKLLADLVRTDRHNHRPLQPDSAAVDALQVLARTHQRLVWDRRRHANQLRTLLREVYPGALAAFPDLTAPAALVILGRAPTAEQGRRLTHRQLEHLLRQAGRVRRLAETATAIQQALRTPQVAVPAVVADAYGHAVGAQVALLGALAAQLGHLEAEMTAQMQRHPDAEIIQSLPGLGPVLSVRVLAEFGDAPDRYADSKARKCYAGTAPITRTSGLKRAVQRRRGSNKFLADTCYWWAFAALRQSPGAAAYYRDHRLRGNTHHQALRALANRLVGILHGCLRYHTCYDEATAWPALVVVPGTEPAGEQTTSCKMTDHHPAQSRAYHPAP